MFIKNLWDKILAIFGIKTQTPDQQYKYNEFYNNTYEDIKRINYNSIFANKLSNYVSNESTISIEPTSERAKLLNSIVEKVDKQKKRIVNRMLGTGGVVLVPYIYDKEVLFNVIPQFRLSINEIHGEKITNATLLADVKTVKDGHLTHTYYRWQNELVKGKSLVITQKYTDENGGEIPKPEIYSDIKQDKIVIPNVDRCLFGYFKSPVDNRKAVDYYGVPVTYGCGSTINEIYETLEQIRREFHLKEAFVGADTTMFKGDNALPENGLYRKVNADTGDFWEVFDPAIRDSSFYARLQELYERLEKEVGTSKGVLSNPETVAATATEIKRSMYDTYTIVEDCREQFEKALGDFIYACDIYANYYELGAMGTYEIEYDWSFDLLENTQETFNQLIQGSNKNAVEEYEIRHFLFPSEDIEESKRIVEEIRQRNEPDIQTIMSENE